MIHLRSIRTNDEAYAFVENLFLSAFPEDERRNTDAQRYNTDENPLFYCCLAEEDNEPIGFFTFWDFDTFCYGEHFAIDPARRNGGYGQQVIRALLEKINRPLVLEVELPEDEMSSRRIGFYERQGFTLWKEVPYTQPSYRPGGHTLPMHLMATEGLNPEEHFEKVKQRIYKDVYLVE
jgi:RimJ/RimL family protein N-acetyltransferase